MQRRVDIPLVICHGPQAPKDLIAAWRGIGAQLIPVLEARGALSAQSVLEELGSLGLTRFFCEGGGGLVASLLKAGLVDELIGFTVGVVLGAEGRPSLAPMGIEGLAMAPRLKLLETRALDGDVLHRWARR